MTSGVYPRKPGLWAGNGGKRHHTPAPKLTPIQQLEVKAMRAKGERVKSICRVFDIGRTLFYRITKEQA